jgi:hypothetical protein
MAEVPLRNTAATLQLTDSGKNNVVVVPKKGNGKLIIRVHKSSKKIGAKEIGLSRALTMALRKYLKYRGDADHDFLLSSKSGNPVTKSGLGKTLHRVTGEILGKAFGSRIIRILAAQDARGVLEEANKLADKMLHATKTQTLQYAKK